MSDLRFDAEVSPGGQSRPSVDVIMPLYNKAPYVAEAVYSALGQSYPIHALYIADDASTDGSREIVLAIARDDPRVQLLVSPHASPQGAAHARNRALAAGSSPIVAFLDADDFWEIDKLERQLALFDDPTVGTVHCGMRAVRIDGAAISSLPPQALPPPAKQFDAVRLGRYNIAGSASTLVTRRSLLSAAGPFREDLVFAEDWDMWARLVGLGGLHAVPGILSNIRMHPTPWQSVSDAERFAHWLGVLDRWKDDVAFMSNAEHEARGVNARHQLGMLLSPYRLLVEYPHLVRTHGGEIGRRLYGSRSAYVRTFLTFVPALMMRAWAKFARRVRS